MNIRTRPFTEAEIQKLIWEAREPWRSIFTLAFLTGLRISDLLLLPSVPVGNSFHIIEKKTHRNLKIIVTPGIKKAWDTLLLYSVDGFLLPFRDPSTYRKSVYRHCVKCFIPTDRVAFHSIRKSCATAIYHNHGFMAANKHLNHSKLSTTLHYIEDDSVKVANALEASIHLHSSPVGGL